MSSVLESEYSGGRSAGRCPRPRRLTNIFAFGKVRVMGSGEFLSELEHLTLCAVVAVQKQAYGISIQQELAKHGRKLSFSTIYATLDRLEKKGYVSSWLGDPRPERGGKPKRCFKIEGAGANALHRSRQTLESMWAAAETNWGRV